ncbi:hypothetical protein OFC24_28245, partial [Escherichia coli]|nr:hypothetical protein [Escherichia coli]
MFCPLSSRSASVLHLFHQSHPQAITRQLIHGQGALWVAHNGAYLMNAIPYFDYSLAPFCPSYQSKVIGVLER